MFCRIDQGITRLCTRRHIVAHKAYIILGVHGNGTREILGHMVAHTAHSILGVHGALTREILGHMIAHIAYSSLGVHGNGSREFSRHMIAHMIAHGALIPCSILGAHDIFGRKFPRLTAVHGARISCIIYYRKGSPHMYGHMTCGAHVQT